MELMSNWPHGVGRHDPLADRRRPLNVTRDMQVADKESDSDGASGNHYSLRKVPVRHEATKSRRLVREIASRLALSKVDATIST